MTPYLLKSRLYGSQRTHRIHGCKYIAYTVATNMVFVNPTWYYIRRITAGAESMDMKTLIA